ncbi:DNA-binding transcriptional LysR family regulator [Pseudorhizobium tarimense]|uniref:DNA-binding transcriptional LysR family regulator n=1 Tax=Pseudorhizobium tarimense TaxID=1079109 RepID=A0ABV2H5M2_9HYPH|nr:LysR family transcriptional regulator [Pseudorhizobium tarimense]MCJ8519046.1 LysR family transcriptional regulator [Pseudorhizobium tarimense]
MDNLNTLHAFVLAAEARSFTVAAQKLGMSASAVGKAIARLEHNLAVRLLHRSTRSVALTPEGELLLVRCRRILHEVEAAEAELSQSRSTPQGKLRISLPLVGMLMMPVLTAFMRAWPDVQLDLDFTDRMVEVVEEGFDVVIRTGQAEDSRLMTRTLGAFGYGLVASPNYLAAHGCPDAISDLARHRCLHHRYPATGRLEQWPLARSTNLPITAVASAIEPLVAMAEADQGIACLPVFAVREQLERGILVGILDGAASGTVEFKAVWPSSRNLSPKVRVFVDFIAAHLSTRPVNNMV